MLSHQMPTEAQNNADNLVLIILRTLVPTDLLSRHGIQAYLVWRAEGSVKRSVDIKILNYQCFAGFMEAGTGIEPVFMDLQSSA
jgi:hypothetical protein